MAETSPPIIYNLLYPEIPALLIAANKGSNYAKIFLKAIMTRLDVMKLLEDISKNSEKEASILSKFADSIRPAILSGSFAPEDSFTIKMRALTEKTMIANAESKSDLDKNARIVHAFLLNSSNSLDSFSFTDESLEKYPEEAYFYFIKLRMLFFVEKYKEAAEFGEEACKKFPENYQLLYMYARNYHYFVNQEFMEEGIIGVSFYAKFNKLKEIYKKFVSISPKDHRGKPEIYYNLAFYYYGHLHKFGRNLENPDRVNANFLDLKSDYNLQMKKYFDLGLKAEKDQISCFLPYDCSTKKVLKEGVEELDKMSESGLTGESVNNKINEKLISSERIKMIKEHRKNIGEFPNMDKMNLNENNNAGILENNGKYEGLACANLEKISKNFYLNESRIYLYERYYIVLTIIEDPDYSSQDKIILVAQDEHFEVARIALTKINFNYNNFEEFLGFGSKIVVIKPKVKFENGEGWIELENINIDNLILLGDKELKMCRFCRSPKGIFVCSKCKRKYCSKECQIKDWKLLKHKLICQ